MNLRLSLGLGSVKGAISTFHYYVQIQTMHRRERNADNDGDAHFRAVDLICVGELANDAPGKELRLVLMLDAGLEHHKFVSAYPAYHIFASYRCNETLRDLSQHHIADRMSELIVDGLKPVQIEIVQGNLLIGATRRCAVQERLADQQSVRKTGEWVIPCQLSQVMLGGEMVDRRSVKMSDGPDTHHRNYEEQNRFQNEKLSVQKARPDKRCVY